MRSPVTGSTRSGCGHESAAARADGPDPGGKCRGTGNCAHSWTRPRGQKATTSRTCSSTRNRPRSANSRTRSTVHQAGRHRCRNCCGCSGAWRHIREARPDVILTFQHYGNTIAAPIAKLVTSAPVVANQVSAIQTMNWPVRMIDLVLGSSGLFKAITVNSADVARMYAKLSPAVSRQDRACGARICRAGLPADTVAGARVVSPAGRAGVAGMCCQTASAQGAGRRHPYAAIAAGLVPRAARSGP